MKPTSVDEYIEHAPEELRGRLRELRKAIRSVAPHAEEKLSYGIPYYGYNGRLAYFAYAKHHIGVYAIRKPVIDQFAKELSGYVKSKGTIQLPHDRPLPLPLIKKLVKAEMKLNEDIEEKNKSLM
jgi:uncharacterized protein YdhG (YjbR/CyaY superfamily)